MNQRRLLYRALPIGIAIIVILFQYFSAEKFTNEAGRTAHLALSPEQEARLGLQSYRQVLQEERTITSGPEYDLVRTVAARLAKATGTTGTGAEPAVSLERDPRTSGGSGPVGMKFDWAVSLVDSPQVNAFCLPGGKIVVYTSILPVAKTDAGLATVMGHEMAHATLRHGSERLFQQKATQTLMTGVQFSLGDMSYEQRRMVLGAIGAGAQYGILMPFGREHESEADAIGLMYMARAGYDPREAITFWERMEQTSGRGAPPEFMSTHPSHGTRIAQLKALLPKALEEYRKSGGR
ncbi:MAG: M48 family metallopeptidase [Chthoniobacteraceae bacterium]